MADRVEYYRGYDIAIYDAGRPKVRAMIRERDGLPPIHAGPQERTVELALEKAKEIIDDTLARHPPN